MDRNEDGIFKRAVTALEKKQAREPFDTRGIDIVLILLWILMSLGYHMDVCDDTALTDAENTIHTASMANLGWDQRNDWVLRRKLLQCLNKDEFPTSYSFAKLLDHTQLRNVFNNVQFRLIDIKYIWKVQGSDGEIRHSNVNPNALLEKNNPRFNSTKSLSTSISEHFNSSDQSAQFLSLHPKFLMINHSVKTSGGLPISELRILNVLAPEVRRNLRRSGWLYGSQNGNVHVMVCPSCRLLYLID